MPQNMIFSRYDDNISKAFDSLGVGKELKPSKAVKAALKDGVKTFQILVNILDSSNNKNVMSLFDRPKVVEQVYFVDEATFKKHRENYEKDQAKARKDPNYKPRIPSPEDAGIVRDVEVVWDFSRYMQGVQLSLNDVKAGKDLELLVKTLKDLKKFSEKHGSKVGMLGGIFGDWANPSGEISVGISSLLTEAEGLKSTLSSVLNFFSSGSDPKSNRRAAGVWVGQLRNLGRKVQTLLSSLTPITSLNNANLVQYLLNTNRFSTTSTTWINFAIACSQVPEFNKYLPTLAKNLVSAGYAPSSFYEDLYYSKPYVSDQAKQFYSGGNFDRQGWLASLSSGGMTPNLLHVWLSYQDGATTKNKLLDIAGGYLSEPKSDTSKMM